MRVEMPFLRLARGRGSLGVLIPVLAALGCYSWRAETGIAPVPSTNDRPSVLRATLADGSRITVYEAQTTPDTLRGWRTNARGGRGQVAISLVDIHQLETRHLDVALTSIAVLVIALPAAVIAIAVAGVSTYY